MIIKIECDSEIKHLSIDFGEAGLKTTTIIDDSGTSTSSTKTPNYRKEKALDLDENFEHEVDEVISKPVIKEVEREVLVSEDMMKAEY
jgi:hypothetical protein